jgi:hypothetical protein
MFRNITMSSRIIRVFKVILVISLILIILGICAKWVIGPIIIPTIVYKNMEITEGTIGYDTWVSISYLHFHYLSVYNY